VVLPTAPRAALGTDLDDSRIPWSPPFTAYLANLPYDVDEDQVKDVFVKCKLKVSQ
jgi:translation initiation factor 4B